MWNLSSGKLSTNKADNSIDVEVTFANTVMLILLVTQSCVMCVACHPHEVAVLAGGTFAGTVCPRFYIIIECYIRIFCFVMPKLEILYTVL